MTPSDSRHTGYRFHHPAYSITAALTRAVWTGLSSSALLLSCLQVPLPRRVFPRLLIRFPPRKTWPSPWHERLGSPIVFLSRLKTSLCSSRQDCSLIVSQASDTPLGTGTSRLRPGVCYPALRRLPGRDLHPLEQYRMRYRYQRKPISLQDAPWG